MFFSIQDLKVHYGIVEAIKGVSLDMEDGAIVTLIGANGSGKSTILKTIIGLKSVSSGEIWFQGKRLDQLKAKNIVAMGISYVPEGRRIFPHMSVLDNLKMGAYSHKDGSEMPKSIEGVFEYFPVLKERQQQMGGSLSGGEQQMLAIGRGLMVKPKMLLLDEPSLGLAPLIVKNVGKIIAELNKTGLSIILVEQNARLALSLAHKGYVLQTGNIVIQGDTKQLRENELVRKAYLGI
jgi:branched-chain amino acid transport system ATP-binding protein